MPQPSARDRFFTALRSAVEDDALSKLTLGKYRGADSSLRKLLVRPVQLKAGPHLSFVWRHATRDITKNLPVPTALAELDRLIGPEFRDAHLFTALQSAQLETSDQGKTRVRFKIAANAPAAKPSGHDRDKARLVDPTAGWLRDLGVTNEHGQPRAGHAPKFRQIQKFAEILQSLLAAAGLKSSRETSSPDNPPPLRLADMGSGKGYLTFATAALLGPAARVTGIERRQDLVDTCNLVARNHNFSQLDFQVGDIASTAGDLGTLEVLIALHACDTATDDALSAGINADASLLVVAPCCQKELRPQLTAPTTLAPALRHGIFQERQAEFVTDALRALLLEAAGFETKVFEFVSTEHTAKNLMIAAIHPTGTVRKPSPAGEAKAREFARFYGIKNHTLARHLNITLE